jgi:hypothetical protein
VITSTEDPEAKEGDPYFIMTLTWDNRSKTEIEINPVVTVRIGAEGRLAARVVDGSVERDQLNVPAGETDQYDVAFLIPEVDRSQVVVEITDPVDPSRNVAFSGSIE